ncbi:SGNH/GDSL hydrolase family protein [Glutamicibacter sp. AGC46]
MTKYTAPHQLPIIEPETDFIKETNVASALARDINAVAMAVNAAISASKFYRGGLSGSDPDANGVGISHISSGTGAQALGLPVSQPGLLINVPFGVLGTRVFITAEEIPQMFGQRKTSTGWRPWADMSKPFYLGGAATTAAAPMNNMDTLPTGAFSLSTPVAAADLGVPLSSSGVGFTIRFGSLDYVFQIVFSQETPSRILTRFKFSGAFSEWSDPIGSRIPQNPSGSGSAASGMKLIPCALTLGQGTTLAPTSRQYRIPFKFNAPINRWRLHITDRNPHNGEHVGAGINISNVYLGNHATNGSFTATPTRIGGGILLDALPDGEWMSAWRTESLGDNVEKILSYDYTSTAAPFAGVGGAYNTSNLDSAAVQFLNGDSTPLKTAAFDIWFEVETYATTPVIAAFGDSLSSGAQATLPCHESVVSLLARREKALPVHFAVSGNAMQDWAADASSYKWTRWEHLGRADVVLWAMGHNDVYRGRSFSQMRADFDICYPLIISRVAPVVVGATVTTRNEPSNPAMHEVRDQWNTWMLAQADSPLADGRVRDVFDFAAAINNGDLLKPQYDSGDNLHLNTAGYVAEVATINHRITTPPVVYAL